MLENKLCLGIVIDIAGAEPLKTLCHMQLNFFKKDDEQSSLGKVSVKIGSSSLQTQCIARVSALVPFFPRQVTFRYQINTRHVALEVHTSFI